MKKIILILLLFLLQCHKVTSQTLITAETSVKYVEAMNFYKQGNYEEALKILKSPHFTINTPTDQNWSILLAQTYLEMKDFSEANNELVQMMKKYPQYQPATQLYQEDIYIFLRAISVRPRITVGAKAGRSYPHFSTKEVYSVYDSTDYAAPYKSLKGYCYQFFVQQNFNGNFALVLDYAYSKFGYKRTLTRNGSDNFELNYSEIIYSNEMGISVKKYIFKNDNKLLLKNYGIIFHQGTGPYLSLGGYYSKMRQAQGNIELNYSYTDPQTQRMEPKNLTRNNINVKDMRIPQRVGLNAAVGSSFTTENGFVISLEAKYMYDLTNLTNPEKRYANPELLYNYYYVDNTVSVNRIDVSLSLAYIFFYKVKSKIK